jgi:hypothetical protein
MHKKINIGINFAVLVLNNLWAIIKTAINLENLSTEKSL